MCTRTCPACTWDMAQPAVAPYIPLASPIVYVVWHRSTNGRPQTCDVRAVTPAQSLFSPPTVAPDMPRHITHIFYAFAKVSMVDITMHESNGPMASAVVAARRSVQVHLGAHLTATAALSAQHAQRYMTRATQPRSILLLKLEMCRCRHGWWTVWYMSSHTEAAHLLPACCLLPAACCLLPWSMGANCACR
jgi:hypothetical protein